MRYVSCADANLAGGNLKIQGGIFMKKNLSIMIAAILAAVSLTACGSSSSSAPAASSEAAPAASSEAASSEGSAEISKDVTTVTPGKLTVATSPDFAPYEFYNVKSGTPELAGFDIALAQRIADELGLELQVVPMDFDGILMELQNGNVDLGISGFSPSPERAQAFDFSDLYYQGGQAFVIRKDDAEKYKGYEDFDGQPVGAQNGSIQMDLANKNTPNANIIGLAKVTDIISELTTGKLEGAFIETAVAEQYIKNYPELQIAWDVEYDAEGSAIALKKGSDLLPSVNAVVKEVLSDGSMDKYITEAQELASDESSVYEGQLTEDGSISTESASTESASTEATSTENASSEAAE